jgi:hypothetical protein
MKWTLKEQYKGSIKDLVPWKYNHDWQSLSDTNQKKSERRINVIKILMKTGNS